MYAPTRLIAITLCSSLLLAANGAHAFGVGIRAGTTGIGADIGFDIIPTLSGRLGYSTFNYDTTVEDTDVKYDAKLKLSNFSALLDWSPAGPFRVTAGFIPNANKIKVTAVPSGSYNINGTNYTGSDIGSLSGEIKPGNSFAPYLGIGYGNVAGAGFNFYADLGVMYMGKPKSTLNVVCGGALNAGQCTQLRNDVAAEQTRLTNESKNMKWYPVANIGVTFGF